jgi:transposase-like protein
MEHGTVAGSPQNGSAGDETYLGGVEEGLRGRHLGTNMLIVVATQEDGPGLGRIHMRQIADASAESLLPFVEESIAPESVVRADGCRGYAPLGTKGYVHEIIPLRRQKKAASELLPRVHRVVSLLKRWLMGTHQGAVRHTHLDYYLDKFIFRFNRRTSRRRGKLFYRLVQQAVAVEPVSYDEIVHRGAQKPKPQYVRVT